MPKCEPLGSADTKKIATAKRAAAKAMPDSETMKRRIQALQKLCGYSSLEVFGTMIGIDARRLRHIEENPSTCKVEEAALLQTLANQLGYRIFDHAAFDVVG